MNMELMNQGLIVTAVGMAVVFVFLLLLVCAMNVSHILLKKIEKKADSVVAEYSEGSEDEDEEDSEAEIAAAIAIAKAMS